MTKVYTFYGGPIHGEQRAVVRERDRRFPPHMYFVRVRREMPSRTLAEYMANHPVAVNVPILHGYRYAVDFDHYKYVGVS